MIEYNENSIKTLDYRESARESLGMYIGSNDLNGMHHLLTEIIANSMDEAAAGYGKNIKVVIDREENRATVIDNGRGIPFKKNDSGNYAIVEMCTNMHSGGKFTGQGNYKSSLGLNGVGATVTNALSIEFSIDVIRDGEHCLFEVFNGDYGDPFIEKTTKKTTGTKVSFVPDPEIFGDAQWDYDKIKDELQLHALLNNGITFELEETKDKKVIKKDKFCYTNGIKDMLKIKTIDTKLLTEPVYFRTHIVNDSGEDCEVEFAFTYSDKGTENIYSFVNGGYTPNNGTHVTGWKTAFTSLINKLARENEVLKDKDKNYSGDIVRKGLILILSIKMSERPLFAEQTKLTLNSPSARTFCSKAVGQLIIDKKPLKQILDKITIEQKAEDAAARKREAEKKVAAGGKNMNALRDLPVKLGDCKIHDDTAELFVCEGDSAAGGAKETRNRYNQAVFPLRGKILNTDSKELGDIIKSEVIKDILTILGCGIGNNFNINNLRYGKIIILTDADPDGSHIELLLMTLFIKHLPELVKAGKIYTAVSPLYRFVGKKETTYFYSEKEMKKNRKVGSLTHIKGLGELDPKELYETTLNPDNRQLIQLQTDDLEAIEELYDRLMGKSAQQRREFILQHKIVADGETFDDDDEEGDID